MKSTLRGLILASVLFGCAQANGQTTTTTISALPSATTPLTGAELVPIVQGGVTKKATVLNMTGVTCTGAFCAATAPLSAALGGNGLDNSGATGFPYWTAGVQSIVGSTGTGSVVLNTSPIFNTGLTLSFLGGGGTQVVCTNNSGVLSAGGCGGGGGTPGGSNTQIQFNNSSAFGGVPGFTWNGTLLTLPNTALGTPASGVATNITGLPILTGVSGLGSGVATALAITHDTSGGICTVGGGGCSAAISLTSTSAALVATPSPITGTGSFALINPLNEQTGTTYTFLSGDATKLVSFSNGSSIAVTLPQSTGLFASGWATNAYNYGAGTSTITPTTSTISGKTTLALGLQQGASIFANGAGNYAAIVGLPQLPQNAILGSTTSGNNYPVALTGTSITNILNGSNLVAFFGSAPSGGACVKTSGTSGQLVEATDCAYLDVAQSWTKAQRGTPATLTLSTATATPNFDNAQNFSLTLSSACPCTFANPSTTPVAGQTGVIMIIQDGTGSRTIGTWGSSYIAPGGVASGLTLSTGANAIDVFSYYVVDSTHIVVTSGALNVSH